MREDKQSLTYLGQPPRDIDADRGRFVLANPRESRHFDQGIFVLKVLLSQAASLFVPLRKKGTYRPSYTTWFLGEEDGVFPWGSTIREQPSTHRVADWSAYIHHHLNPLPFDGTEFRRDAATTAMSWSFALPRMLPGGLVPWSKRELGEGCGESLNLRREDQGRGTRSVCGSP